MNKHERVSVALTDGLMRVMKEGGHAWPVTAVVVDALGSTYVYAVDDDGSGVPDSTPLCSHNLHDALQFPLNMFVSDRDGRASLVQLGNDRTQ